MDGHGVGEIVVSGLPTLLGEGETIYSRIVGGSWDFARASGVLKSAQIMDESMCGGCFFQDRAVLGVC